MAQKHVIVCGPESTGKSEIVDFLGKQADIFGIKEYAREHLESRSDPSYTIDDVVHMAFVQFQRQLEAMNSDYPMIVSDTGMLNFMIWTEYKYGFVPQQILDWFYLQKSDLHLLCYPDIDWTPDPLRENPNDREELFELYQKMLKEHNLDYRIVKGFGQERFDNAYAIITDYFAN